MKIKQADIIWMSLVLLALLVIYLPGLGNPLIFDDDLLSSGSLFSHYGAHWPLKPRLLSYGSFVWVRDLFGSGWPVQRLFNLAIHIGVVLSLWGFYREILGFVASPDTDETSRAQVSYKDSPALGLVIGFFALNPVAVYAVAYLIERSILMATLFVVLTLFFFARALARRKKIYFVGALLCYILAVASKENALLAPFAALPVYILIARPAGRRLAAVAGLSGLLVAAVVALLLVKYGSIIGQPFDKYSHIYLAQLAALAPGVQHHAWPLSIVNQSYLFFQYGLHWLVPYSGWMSIDMRPPFPIQLLAFPQILGVVGYLAVLVGGFYLIVRYRDWRALLGLSLLLPATLFPTEYATVWVQDPFVLYRSYLWAIGLPGILFFLFHGLPQRVLLVLGICLAALLVWQAANRVNSLSSLENVWSDAIDKLPDNAQSVGRWFAYFNRGEYYLNQNRLADALKDFKASSDLGDGGLGMYDTSAIYLMTGRYQQALAAIDKAAKQGNNLPNLDYQRGIALSKLGRLPEAIQSMKAALDKSPPPEDRKVILAAKGLMELKSGRLDAAITDYVAALKIDPGMAGVTLQLAMTYIAEQDYARAVPLLDKLLAKTETAAAYYGRAWAYYGLNRKAKALSDIDNALRLGPGNPVAKALQARIQAMP